MPPNDQYILAFDSGRIIAGATHENDTGMDLRVTAGGLREIFDKALTVAPGPFRQYCNRDKSRFQAVYSRLSSCHRQSAEYQRTPRCQRAGRLRTDERPYLGAELAKLALGQQTEIDLSLYDPAGALE